MKNHVVFTLFISLLLMACSHPLPTHSPVETAAISPHGENEATGTDTTLTFPDDPNGISFASSDNACLDSFNLLKSVSQAQFDRYLADYEAINQEYAFLVANKTSFDNDPQTLSPLSVALEKKLDLLCAKVEATASGLVRDRLQRLTDI